jgi:hypothetical protein
MKVAAAILGILLIGGAAFGQHGTAPDGFYPGGYTGNTWRGVVTGVNEETGEFTLTHTSGNKTETFVGVPEEGYILAPKDGPERPLKLSDIPLGKTMTVFYNVVTNKVNGKKVTVNSVINIDSMRNNKKQIMHFTPFNN